MKNMTSLHARKSSGRSALRRGFFLIPVALACFALLPTARAVDPPPDGGYLNQNTAEGEDALFSLTTGFANTAIGLSALYSNTTGSYNTANGYEALYNNTTGSYNTATGALALTFNTTGNSNTANGFEALYSNTGTANTAIGDIALFRNTTGTDNTASGFEAMAFNTIGSRNVATGSNALYSNQIGGDNTATGVNALYKNTVGSYNIALGYNAGYSLSTGSNNIDIGNSGLAAEANTIRIGSVRTQTNTYIAGISGITVAGGVGVIVDTNGHLGTVVSSARFKDAIKPMDKASEAILALKPVTFHYKQELDPEGIPQFGLVAEEVEKVNPDLVVRDDQGKPYTVRYEAVNAMLLNEFLKEHRKVEVQEAIITQLKSTVAEQQKGMEAVIAHLKEQDSKIQKVSTQIELNKSAPRTVLNTP
jgi:uncharacterized coiled-coil protein SlyX